jgi:protein-tyrosine phosphatase
MPTNNIVRVLFICTGNICRSPMAEFIFRDLVGKAGLSEKYEIASAATSSWEIGEPVHPGTLNVLRKHQVPLDPQKRARQVTPDDYLYFDHVLAMDSYNLHHMPNMDKISPLTSYAPSGSPRDVPDPYYTGDFEYVYSKSPV